MKKTKYRKEYKRFMGELTGRGDFHDIDDTYLFSVIYHMMEEAVETASPEILGMAYDLFEEYGIRLQKERKIATREAGMLSRIKDVFFSIETPMDDMDTKAMMNVWKQKGRKYVNDYYNYLMVFG